jgi:hypothetical protein
MTQWGERKRIGWPYGTERLVRGKQGVQSWKGALFKEVERTKVLPSRGDGSVSWEVGGNSTKTVAKLNLGILKHSYSLTDADETQSDQMQVGRQDLNEFPSYFCLSQTLANIQSFTLT